MRLHTVLSLCAIVATAALQQQQQQRQHSHNQVSENSAASIQTVSASFRQQHIYLPTSAAEDEFRRQQEAKHLHKRHATKRQYNTETETETQAEIDALADAQFELQDQLDELRHQNLELTHQNRLLRRLSDEQLNRDRIRDRTSRAAADGEADQAQDDDSTSIDSLSDENAKTYNDYNQQTTFELNDVDQVDDDNIPELDSAEFAVQKSHQAKPKESKHHSFEHWLGLDDKSNDHSSAKQTKHLVRSSHSNAVGAPRKAAAYQAADNPQAVAPYDPNTPDANDSAAGVPGAVDTNGDGQITPADGGTVVATLPHYGEPGYKYKHNNFLAKLYRGIVRGGTKKVYGLGKGVTKKGYNLGKEKAVKPLYHFGLRATDTSYEGGRQLASDGLRVGEVGVHDSYHGVRRLTGDTFDATGSVIHHSGQGLAKLFRNTLTGVTRVGRDAARGVVAPIRDVVRAVPSYAKRTIKHVKHAPKRLKPSFDDQEEADRQNGVKPGESNADMSPDDQKYLQDQQDAQQQQQSNVDPNAPTADGGGQVDTNGDGRITPADGNVVADDDQTTTLQQQQKTQQFAQQQQPPPPSYDDSVAPATPRKAAYRPRSMPASSKRQSSYNPDADY